MIYVVGIALVIILLPVIASYGLFGVISSGSSAELVDYDRIMEQLPAEQQEIMTQYNDELDNIKTVFKVYGLSDTDVSKAQIIYMSCLIGKETEENFYERYVDCFLTQSEESDLLTNISSTFGVTFSDEDRQQFLNLYS